jgi:hypothetical protein
VLVSGGANRYGSQEKKREEGETFSQAKGQQALDQEEEPLVVHSRCMNLQLI